MKRILVLNYEFPPIGGGGSTVSYELAEKLSKTGDFDIDVVTMAFKDLSQYEEVNSHFRIHRVKCLRRKKEICHPWEQATYLVSAWFKCKELVQKRRYDLCHAHFIVPTGVLAFILKRRFGLPYIITAHGSDVPGYNKRFKFIHPFLAPLRELILDNAKYITSPSFFLNQMVSQTHKLCNHIKNIVVPNGLDTRKFQPQEKKRYIFSSGRLVRPKGFHYLIQAVSDEDIGYEVHIAGDGPMMDELQQLAKKSKTKIVLHGWLDNNGDVFRNLLEQSAIFVLASDVESAGMSLLEGMSAGCFVVTTNASGSKELVGDSGMTFNVGDVRVLKDILYSITNDQRSLNDFQDSARKRVVTFYDWDVIINKYIKIYE